MPRRDDVIYDHVTYIEATTTAGKPDEHGKLRHKFFHDFKPGCQAIALHPGKNVIELQHNAVLLINPDMPVWDEDER